MKDMTKEIAAGLITLVGMGVVVIAADMSLPVLATAGAISALGAGVYSALSAPHHKKNVAPPRDDDDHGIRQDAQRTLVGRV